MVRVPLRRADFEAFERLLLETDSLQVSAFRYSAGVEALRLGNSRGHLIVLPFMGQMIWDAVFDDVDLTMTHIFAQPRPVDEIVATYGCLAFHSGLLRNGCPSPEDSHALHGEMPCAAMDSATLVVEHCDDGVRVRIEGEYEYAMGFGDHYRATPWVELAAESTLFRMGMTVENLASVPMDLMYMCHINFAFWDNARIVQPAPFTPEHTRVRSAIPGHVPATADYRGFIDELAEHPERMETLDEPERYAPEQVFYLDGPGRDNAGMTQSMLQRPAGDALFVRYSTEQFAHTVRWILRSEDQQVCAFALPSTCEPEGYIAEQRKGHVQSLAPGERRLFDVQLGYLNADAAGAEIRQTERLFDDDSPLEVPMSVNSDKETRR